MDFAVWHEGMEEGTATWVLAVDGEHFLLAGDDHAFYWKAISDCKLIKAATPENPRLVIPVQPQQGIAIPNGNGLRGL